MAGLSVAAAAYVGKQALQAYMKFKVSPPSLKSYYKVRGSAWQRTAGARGSSVDCVRRAAHCVLCWGSGLCALAHAPQPPEHGRPLLRRMSGGTSEQGRQG